MSARWTARTISLAATLPAGAKLSILPQWVKASGPTTLSFDGLAAKFGTEAEVTVGGKTLKTVIEGRVARSGQRTSIGFTGTISNWKNPFNVSWLTSLDKAEVRLDTSFGGGRQAEVKADISASARLGGKDFTLGFALSNGAKPTATVTATAQTGATLGEIAKVFTNDLAGAARDVANNPKLNTLAIGPVSASLSSDRKLALTASATFEGLRSELLVVARTNQFTLGIKTREAVDLEKLAGVPGITLPKAAMVLGNSNGDRSVASLTDGEFDFYKTLYGCADDATRGECTKFTRLSLTRGLTLLAGFDLGEKMTEAAGAIGVQTGGNAILAGTLPVLGGKLSLSASLGDLRFANAPDWFHSGQMKLEINDGGVALAGTLRVKIDDDLLAFTVRAELGFQPVRIALSGELIPEGDGIWRNAFGQDWLSIKRLALQIEVTGTADVTFGFQGDVDINGKDIAAALKVGISPIPPFRPNLIGFSAASRAGLSLKDLLWLNERITNVKIDPDKLPDIGVRNLFLQFSQQDDPELCLKQGVRFNAELYLGTPGQKSAGDEGDLYDDKGCRNLDVKPVADDSCDRETDGCLARVYGRLDSGGLIAGGQLNGFELGPVEFEDSLLALELTRDTQSLRVKGGLRIATDDYEFAEGRADLEISRTQFKFSGDASLFNDELQGYLEGERGVRPREPVVRGRGLAARRWSRRHRQGGRGRGPAAPAGDRRVRRGAATDRRQRQPRERGRAQDAVREDRRARALRRGRDGRRAGSRAGRHHRVRRTGAHARRAAEGLHVRLRGNARPAERAHVRGLRRRRRPVLDHAAGNDLRPACPGHPGPVDPGQVPRPGGQRQVLLAAARADHDRRPLRRARRPEPRLLVGGRDAPRRAPGADRGRRERRRRRPRRHVRYQAHVARRTLREPRTATSSSTSSARTSTRTRASSRRAT